jgi:hypothetical protein
VPPAAQRLRNHQFPRWAPGWERSQEPARRDPHAGGVADRPAAPRVGRASECLWLRCWCGWCGRMTLRGSLRRRRPCPLRFSPSYICLVGHDCGGGGATRGTTAPQSRRLGRCAGYRGGAGATGGTTAPQSPHPTEAGQDCGGLVWPDGSPWGVAAAPSPVPVALLVALHRPCRRDCGGAGATGGSTAPR